jgi:hypothetical protein
MAASVDDVKAVDPANTLEGVKQSLLDRLLVIAAECVNPAAWDRVTGTTTISDHVQALYVAHMATMLLRGSDGLGPVTAEAAGGLSRSYAAGMRATDDPSLSSTSFGQQILMLSKKNALSKGTILYTDFNC